MTYGLPPPWLRSAFAVARASLRSAFAAACTAVRSAFAASRKQQNEPLPPDQYPAGVVCDFDLTVEFLIDTGHSITFSEGSDGSVRAILGGHLVVMVTNDDTGASVTHNISGPGKFLFQGDVLHITGYGAWLLYSFAGDAGGPGMWFTRGQLALEVDLNTGVWLSASKPRNTIDVCAVLGGSSAPE